MATNYARLIFRLASPKSIGSIEIDAFTSEIHILTSSISRYPLDDGSEASDHIVNDPERVEITGIAAAAKLVAFVPGTFVNRAIDVYRDLTDLFNQKKLISVVTGLKVYNNMHISDFRVPRNSRNGGALSFTMTLVAARIVRTSTVEIPAAILTGDDETQEQAQSEADVGKTDDGQGLLTSQISAAEIAANNALDRIGIEAVE